jgi:branched-chain amino acid transport system ATP-binding protein
VRLGDEELVGLAPHRIARKGVVHVPQGDMIFTDLTVAENLRLAESIGRRAGRAGATLAEVHDVFPVLAERRAQQAGTLSGGERRMLALARGMLVAAEVLLIDEPSLGLAPAVVATVYAHIATLRETGRAMVVVDESPMRLRGIADRLCLIDRGSVVAAGRTEELLGNESVLKTYLGMEVAV